MGMVDRQRVAAVRVLEELNYRFDGQEWKPPCEPPHWPEADAMHAVLMDRASDLLGCIEGSGEEEELERIGDALDAYEARRWPNGRVAGGKG
ncbi:MAG: hypothetical protein KJZ83_00095 [Burkholderiaceae bacterium]|nr:hypothetical protein [Burkholderiaceae bacterium]